MIVRVYLPQQNAYQIKSLSKRQLVEEFVNNPALEKVDVLKISRTITRKRIVG